MLSSDRFEVAIVRFDTSWSTTHGQRQQCELKKMEINRNCISKRLHLDYGTLRHCSSVLRCLVSLCVASAILFNLFYSPSLSLDRYPTLIRWLCLDNVSMVFHQSFRFQYITCFSSDFITQLHQTCFPALYFFFLLFHILPSFPWT